MSKCMYCKTELNPGSVLDVCRRCGVGVWGESMFNAIVQNMKGAKESGDLYQGSVTKVEGKFDKKPQKKAMPSSLVKDAVSGMDSFSKEMESLTPEMEKTF